MALWKRILAITVGLSAFVALIIYTSLAEERTSCEVCIEYKGNRNCARAAGEDEGAASRAAADAACALISSGVTERIACPGTPPFKRSCRPN